MGVSGLFRLAVGLGMSIARLTDMAILAACAGL